MNKIIIGLALFVSTNVFAGEDPSPVDRVCIGRGLIIQAMQIRKDRGETQADYITKEVAPYRHKWRPEQLEEVQSVVKYVWEHNSNENEIFAAKVIEACYEKYKGS